MTLFDFLFPATQPDHTKGSLQGYISYDSRPAAQGLVRGSIPVRQLNARELATSGVGVDISGNGRGGQSGVGPAAPATSIADLIGRFFNGTLNVLDGNVAGRGGTPPPNGPQGGTLTVRTDAQGNTWYGDEIRPGKPGQVVTTPGNPDLGFLRPRVVADGIWYGDVFVPNKPGVTNVVSPPPPPPVLPPTISPGNFGGANTGGAGLGGFGGGNMGTI